MDARMLCGHDVRQTGMWPADEARVEAFVARYGGMLCAMPVGNVAIALEWQAEDGRVVRATAASVADAFVKLRTTIDTTN